MLPWFRRSDFQMPAHEVESLTLRQADAYLMDWVRRQETSDYEA